MTHQFKVRAGLTINDLSVEMDGEKLEGVTGVKFSLTADNYTVLQLDIFGQVLIEGEYYPKEIAQIRRDMTHPYTMSSRVRSALIETFGDVPTPYIDGLTRKIVGILDEQDRDAA